MISDLEKAIEACLADGRPIPEQLRAAELRRGFALADYQHPHWQEWSPDSVISFVNAPDLPIFVRLMLIIAEKPGTGAFTRLVANMARVDLVPLVIDPTDEFYAMLHRRGWRELLIGETFEERECWMVPRGHMDHAKALAKHLNLLALKGAP